MDITHFAFAFYVFILVCGTIWFHSRLMRAGKKKDKSSYEKEQRLFSLYQNIEDMLGSFEEYAEEARAGIDARMKQAEALIESAQNEIKSKPEPKTRRGGRAAKPAPESTEEVKKPQKSTKSSPAKAKPKPKTEELVQQYLAQGMNKEEIAKALDISLREVSLIMEIKKIHM